MVDAVDAMSDFNRSIEETNIDVEFASQNPAELLGLNEFIAGESIGGNAGKSHLAANAVYDKGIIRFSNKIITSSDFIFFDNKSDVAGNARIN